MPQARAADSLEPSAKTRRPNTVLRRTMAIKTAKAIVIHTPGASNIHEGLGKVTASSFTHVEGTLTVSSAASHLATPRATPSMPSVAIKGTTRRRVIAAAFMQPMTPPPIYPARTASARAHAFRITHPVPSHVLANTEA